MKKRNSMRSIFIEMLSDSKDATTRMASTHVDDLINASPCSDLFDILVINALGYQCPVSASMIDSAIKYIIAVKCLEINNSSVNECDRNHEIELWNDFYSLVGNDMKNRFRQSGLLVEA